MDKKNILFITNSILPSIGGIEKVNELLRHLFEEDGNNCFFVFFSVDNVSVEENKKKKICLNQSRNSFYKELNLFIKEHDINIIINQGITYSRIIYSLKRIRKDFTNISIIHCLHNTPYYIQRMGKPKSLKIKLILAIKTILACKNVFVYEQQQIYKLCDHFVVLSQSFIDEAKEVFRLKDNNKLTVISNPLIYNTMTNHKKQKKVLIVARFDENQKNIIGALNIWNIVSRQKPDWTLHIVGYGENEDRYKTYIKEQNIQNIIFEGKKEDTQPFYEKASIFMMTSYYEGFALTLIEALQNKCIPFVYNTFSSVSDIIINEKNGIIIPPFEVDMYAQKMIDLMSDNILMENYRANSNISLMQFEPLVIKQKWYELFNQ